MIQRSEFTAPPLGRAGNWLNMQPLRLNGQKVQQFFRYLG